MKNVESIVLHLDAAKAFDTVRWEFLYLVLKRFGFNSQIIGCLRSLHNLPTARIKGMATRWTQFLLTVAADSDAHLARDCLHYLLSCLHRQLGNIKR